MGTPADLAESLTTIREHVLKLRESGVHVSAIHVDSGLVKMTLESLDVGTAPRTRDTVEDDPNDAMQDPASYGLPPGSRVPGFDRPTRDDDEEPR